MLHVRMCLGPEDGAAFLAGVNSLAERTARRVRLRGRRSTFCVFVFAFPVAVVVSVRAVGVDKD